MCGKGHGLGNKKGPGNRRGRKGFWLMRWLVGPTGCGKGHGLGNKKALGTDWGSQGVYG